MARDESEVKRCLLTLFGAAWSAARSECTDEEIMKAFTEGRDEGAEHLQKAIRSAAYVLQLEAEIRARRQSAA